MEAVSPTPPVTRPRIWSALSVTALAILGSVIAAGIVQAGALFAMGIWRPGSKSFDVLNAMEQLTAQWWGPAALILPGQLSIILVTLVAAALSPQKIAPRLGYTSSRLPWHTLPLLLGGTYLAGALGSLVPQSFFHDPGLSMRIITNVIQQSAGFGQLALAAMICIVPPVGEEMLFRGYLQRRLLQRWSPAAAIATSSACFVISHFDPIHILSVIPLGVWLGIIAWRCGSLWPSMICHAAQNTYAFWAARHGDPLEAGVGWIVALVVSVALTIGAVIAMRRNPIVSPEPPPTLPHDHVPESPSGE